MNVNLRELMRGAGTAVVTVVAGAGLALAVLPSTDGIKGAIPAWPYDTSGAVHDGDDPVLTQREGTYLLALVRGILGREGECLTLTVGTAHPVVVIWPPGTRWSADGETVVLPDGLPVAQGDEVTGSGGYFAASRKDLTRSLGAEMANRAVDCTKQTGGDVAFINFVKKA